MFDFHLRFLPAIIRIFETSDVQFVFWAEDDIIFPPKNQLPMLLKFLESDGRSSAVAVWWCAWLRVQGVPRYGAHFLCVTRVGASILKAHLDCLRAECFGPGPRISYLCALDTFLFNSVGVVRDGVALVKATPKSWAKQRRHAFKGRR